MNIVLTTVLNLYVKFIMKRFNFVLFLAIAGTIVMIYLSYRGNYITATKSDLEAVRLELSAQIDSVLRNQDSIKAELRAVRQNTDTLKAGQEVIFKTMQENQSKSLLNFLHF